MTRLLTTEQLAEHRARMARYRTQMQGPIAEHVDTLRLALMAPEVTVPWPPSGNHSVKHANGAHYLRQSTLTYRRIVANACINVGRVMGRYVLHVHFAPPDERERDMDNALKTLFDALKKAAFIPSDSMTYMRELHCTVDDTKRGCVIVRAVPIVDQEAAA